MLRERQLKREPPFPILGRASENFKVGVQFSEDQESLACVIDYIEIGSQIGNPG
jgi:hypothetical protein